ncbi:hypothetical protein EN46_24775 [Citrobacter amalonaticus]
MRKKSHPDVIAAGSDADIYTYSVNEFLRKILTKGNYFILVLFIPCVVIYMIFQFTDCNLNHHFAYICITGLIACRTVNILRKKDGITSRYHFEKKFISYLFKKNDIPDFRIRFHYFIITIIRDYANSFCTTQQIMNIQITPVSFRLFLQAVTGGEFN